MKTASHYWWIRWKKAQQRWARSRPRAFLIVILALGLYLAGISCLNRTSRWQFRPSLINYNSGALSMLAVSTARSISQGAGRREPKKHVMVLLGTRPEAIKLAPVILELKTRLDRFHCTVVSTGQHQSMLLQVLSAFGLGSASLDLSLDVMTVDQSLASLTSRVMARMDEVFRHVRPDLVIVQGDTMTAFIGALAAFYHKIPVGHVEAGLRTHNRYSPFPEEVNRQGIGVLASLHFAATDFAANNLINEGKDGATIFVTGNPVVDALQTYASAILEKGEAPSAAVQSIETAKHNRCAASGACRVVLLTAHRRENHGKPLRDIIKAVSEVLRLHPDVLVVYPVHLNPNVRRDLAASLPAFVYAQLGTVQIEPDSREGFDADVQHLRRLLLLPPLDYPDLVQIMQMSEIIVTDSGGIQEEGAVLGKPIVVLRDTTERPEGVHAGVARLIGTSPSAIITEMGKLLQRTSAGYTAAAAAAQGLYGDGHAAQRIVDIADWYLNENERSRSMPPVPDYAHASARDLVVVLTVWKRATLGQYLEMLSKQSLLRRPGFRTTIVVFQNGHHLDVRSTIDEWQSNRQERWGTADVVVEHIQSPLATGYYGRFLVPLLAKVHSNGYFIVCDDDVIFGARYLENMIRVVDTGSLAVRVGRFVTSDTTNADAITESFGMGGDKAPKGFQVTNEEDVVYDFGGHLWAGRFGWLHTLWSHPPPVWITSEDFWISAVLRTHLGVHTKRPRCPTSDVEQCACSMDTAEDHAPVEVGAVRGGEFAVRNEAMSAIAQEYDYRPLGEEWALLEARAYTVHPAGQGPFQVHGTWVENCLYFA